MDMSRWLWIVAALGLVGCASDGYRYYDDGYYAAERAPSRSLVVSGSFSTCASWGSPWRYPYYGYGYGYGPAYGCGYGYGYGYGYGGWYGGGYWGYPSWPGGWYPPHMPNAPTAGQRARQMAGESVGEAPEFSRYEDLAPERGRDTGGSSPAWRSAPPRSSYPSYYQGYQGIGRSTNYGTAAPSGLSGAVNRGGTPSGISGGSRYGSQPMPGSSRSDFGPRSGFGDRGPSSSGSIRSSEPVRSNAAGQARSISRDERQEE